MLEARRRQRMLLGVCSQCLATAFHVDFLALKQSAWRLRMRTLLAALGLLAIVVLGCGSGVIIISVNSGTIASDPLCDGGMGRFDLRNQAGLVLLVVISSDTVIFNADGRPGRCADLTNGAHVQVRGPQHGNQINAQSVNVG
jgi:hypothetical protein